MGLKYRLEQFWQLVHAEPLSPEAWRQVEAILAPAEVSLFRHYVVADRRHAYRVLETLKRSGAEHPALLTAALLHDVGKTRCRLFLWERMVGALADICCPGRVRQWGRGAPHGWRRPFVIREQHPQWGAEMVQAAGSSPLVVTLVRWHQEKEELLPSAEAQALLRRLQWADDQN